MSKLPEKPNDSLYSQIRDVLDSARKAVSRTVNTAMVLTYFEVGRLIIEHEQHGETRAEYGKETLKELSKKLTKEFGKGFSVQNLENMRKFYAAYSKSQTLSVKSQKSQTLSRKSTDSFKLSWSHYLLLMRMEPEERSFYEIEARNENWSVRELERQYNAGLYERLKLSRNKKQVKDLSKKGLIINKPEDAIKDPYVLEFLGLEEKSVYSESDLEQAIINKIEHFMLELGKGFLFAGRQVRLSFDEEHFYVDLVFYNRLLRCFVLVDLKIGKLKHQDLGQMQMYVNYYDREMKAEDENPTIGIVLCKDKNDSLVEITLPKGNKQIYASKYKLYLPTKAELKKQLEG